MVKAGKLEQLSHLDEVRITAPAITASVLGSTMPSVGSLRHLRDTF